MIKNIKKTISNFFNFILFRKKSKEVMFLVVFLIAILGIFFIGNSAQAGVGDTITNILTWIIHGIVWVLGRALLVLIFILTPVASYGDFVNSPPVREAWHIVRDLCNMFFILILLIIAFATILRIESYNVKKALPKLLVMAVLINFSKTICGVLIDASQIIMLTFVNSFQSLGQGNLTEMLGISELLNFSFEKRDIDAFQDESNKVTATSVLGVYVLALIYVLISIVVMAVIIGVLIMRIVMIWIYIVLSPFAYLLAAFPQGQKYASQWWGEFSKALIVGPVLAFFIWLSFTSLGNREAGSVLTIDGEMQAFENAPVAGISKTGSANHMIKFGLSIGMLLGGLIITQQIGGVFGTITSKTVAGFQKGQGLAIKGALGTADMINRKQYKGIQVFGKKIPGTGFDFNVGRRMESIKQGLEKGKNKDLQQGEQSAQRNLSQGGALGLATGWSAKGYGDTLRGFKAPKQALAALFGHGTIRTKGITEDAVKEHKNNKQYSKDIITQDEYNSKTKQLDQNWIDEDDKQKRLGADLALKNVDIAKASPGKDKEKLESEANEISEEIHDSKKAQKSFVSDKQVLVNKKNGIGADGKAFEDDQGKLLFVKTEEEKEDRIKGYDKKADKAKKQTSFYMDTNLDVVMEEKSGRAEEKNKIGDIKDEDHIISLMDAADTQGNFVRWGALGEKLAEINGTNNLMARNGYNVDTSGLDDNEFDVLQKVINGDDKVASKKAKKEYDEGKGWNDYMREKGKKFGVQRQSVLRLQTDIGSIGEAKRALHLQKTVGVDASGQLKLTDRKTRVRVQMIENNKRGVENSLRNDNRLEYGGEGIDGKDFKFDESGLAFITEHIDKVVTLMDGQRFNPSSVAAFAEKTAQKQLRKALEYMGKTEIQGKNQSYTIDGVLKRFRDESKSKSDKNFEAITRIVRDER